MSKIPSVQTAIVGTYDAKLEVSHEARVPRVKGDMVLVRTKAISINPVDAKMVGLYVTAGAIAGCDFAGEVILVGPDVHNQDIEIGDRVCGAVMGMNPLVPSTGAFASFVGASASNMLRISPTLSYEQGSTIGTSFMTSGLALFYSLALPGDPAHPLQSARPVYVLVSGGATANGTAALQLLRLSGFTPIATCSPRHFELVKSYGANAAFDYSSLNCAKDIRTYTKSNLRYAMDCVTTVDSMKLCYAALGRAGGSYTSLDPFPADSVEHTRKMVKADWVLGPLMMGIEIAWPEPHNRAPDAEVRKFGLRWRSLLEKLFHEQKLRTHPIKIETGGFEGALDGLELVKKGVVRGEKLVYPIQS